MGLSGKRILVTGADGFIGSHLAEELVRRGATVRAFVLYNSFNSWGWLDRSPAEIKRELDVVAGDIRDPHSIEAAAQGCDIVMHLAALISIPYSYVAPASFVETNVRGTLNVLQAARKAKAEQVIHTSTSEVYGSAQRVPITEEHPLRAQSPYAASKIAADQLALSFHASFGLPVTVLRPFNTYGPRQSARAVIPTAITQLARRNGRIKLGSLHPTRDFSYVSDTVAGFIAAAETRKGVGEVINLGSNFEVSIGDTVRLIAELMGRSDAEIETDAQRVRPPNSEVERLWSDNRKAQELLGWSPRYGALEGLRRGLQETIAWFTDPAAPSSHAAERYNI
jgi:NAD dependent epimerase/dehydratase